MNIRQCSNGHYFDADSSERCPSCGAQVAEDSNTIVRSASTEPELTVTEYTHTTGATLPDIGIEDLLGGSFGDFEKTEKKAEPKVEEPEEVQEPVVTEEPTDAPAEEGKPAKKKANATNVSICF